MIIPSAAGAGKSIIWYDNLAILRVHELMMLASSAIIEDVRILQRSGLASLAFFYCDFRDDQKKDLRGLLSSLLVQLGEQSDAYSTVLSDFYATHGRGSQHASDSELVGCLKDMLNLPGQAKVYIVIDALDECPVTTGLVFTRKNVLEFVEELINLHIPNLRICVTSRPESDITDVLGNLAFCSVSLHGERGQVWDIAKYVRSFVHSSREMRRWKATDKQLVIDELTNKADGMYVIHATITYFACLHLKCRFRWVVCQLVYLSRCIPGRIRHALKELPTTLDATYARTLKEIDEQNWEYAHRLFQCVAAASRPLRAAELAEFLAFNFDAGSTPTFLADWRSEDPENEVLSICSTLLIVVKPPSGSGSPIIQFAHFSVKEYLTSKRLAETKDHISRFHVSLTRAHTIVAQACLGILLHLDENITEDKLKDFPLAEYAAKQWVDHALFENVSSKVQDEMDRLFDPSKIHFSVWAWIYNHPANPPRRRRRFQHRAAARVTPLHYAAFYGLRDVATTLIVEHSQSVNARGFGRKETPLHVALRKGQVEIVWVLLKYGADTEARDYYDYSPLEHASREGHAELAQVLLEHGADANSQDILTCTPLYRASEAGQVAVAQVLLNHGADVAAHCMNNETPLHRAEDAEVARLLLEHGADANARDINNRTPLHRVSGLGRVGATRVLLEHGVDANARDANDATPLHLASNRVGNWYGGGGGEHVGVIRLLLQYSSDIHARDDKGQTPFMRAAAEEYHDIMEILLENGAEDQRVITVTTDGQGDVVM
jgi:ankyrin repeat protein